MFTFKTKAALVCAIAFTALSGPTLAESDKKIQLSAKDGTATISGQFVGVEGGKYVIVSDVLGLYEVPVSRVNCFGVACPEIAQADLETVLPAGLLAASR